MADEEYSGLRRVCVFCGSSVGRRAEYQKAAREAGRLLAERGIGMVYGGGRIGLMGIAADAALTAGGKVIGVIPEALALKEVAHAGLTELHVVRSMHERKAMMAELSDGFIALPGGFGTFEEFCEIVTWSQLGLHRKPCGLLNVNGYYDPLVSMIDASVQEGFVRQHHRGLILHESSTERMLTLLEEWRPSPALPIEKWIEPSET
jgi:uncharacterized protein (TIGR00730 family)